MSQNLTQKGTLVGTFRYMSPEQLQGRDADPRSDIFGFGAVLYEMLTAKRAFAGETVASVIGAILHSEPAAAPELTGPLEPVLRRCLAKDPDERWQSAADLKWELEHLRGEKVAPSPQSHRRPLAWITLAVVAVLGWAVAWLRPPASETRSFRLAVTPPPGSEFAWGSRAGSAISPDGRLVAFIATSAGKTSLWVRPLDSVAARQLPGTEDAFYPFWSPDSKSLAFFASSKIKRIDVAGGAPQALCDAPRAGRGGAWSSQGRE